MIVCFTHDHRQLHSIDIHHIHVYLIRNPHASGTSEIHVDERITVCRRTTFGLQGRGMSYPGLGSDVKAHLWKTTCSPALTYGMDCVQVSNKSMHKMESLQGTLMKRCLGVPKYNHHSTILQALDIVPITKAIEDKTITLFQRLLRVESQTKDVCMTLMARYILNKQLYDETLVERLVRMGISPIETAYSCFKPYSF